MQLFWLEIRGLKMTTFDGSAKKQQNIKANKIYYKELKFRSVSSGKSDSRKRKGEIACYHVMVAFIVCSFHFTGSFHRSSSFLYRVQPHKRSGWLV